MDYFTITNCTPDQLDELRSAYFWADDTDPATLTGITFPSDIPNWLLFQQYAGIMFTNDDFSCSAGKERWCVFYHGEKELCAYTLYGTFPGEKEATTKQLAYEKDLDPKSIRIEYEWR